MWFILSSLSPLLNGKFHESTNMFLVCSQAYYKTWHKNISWLNDNFCEADTDETNLRIKEDNNLPPNHTAGKGQI